jgi:type II secretory pathway component PulJ
VIEKTYAGIGSRETPKSIQRIMVQIADDLEQAGYILQSGGADGADSAFEGGLSEPETTSRIFLPKNGFNGRWVSPKTPQYIVPEYREDILAKYHPKNPRQLSESARLLLSRNAYQVLGPELRQNVDFIVCWTSDGKASGGTGQALRIAADKGIDVYNLYHKEDQLKLSRRLMEL